MRRATLALRVALLLGACSAGCLGTAAPAAAKGRAKMAAWQLVPIDMVVEAGGEGLAFAPDGQRWASTDASWLRLGRGGAVERTVYPSDGRIVGAPCFLAAGAVVAPPFELAAGADHLDAPFGDLKGAFAAGQALPSRGRYDARAAACSGDGATLYLAGNYRAPSGLAASSSRPVASARLLRLGRGGGVQVIADYSAGEGPLRLAVSVARLAAAGDQLELFDAQAGRRVAQLTGHIGIARAIAFSPDGAKLASGGADGQLLLWSSADGKRLAAARPSSEPIGGVAFSPDGASLAVCGDDDLVRLVSASNPSEELARHALGAHGRAIAFSPDGSSLRVALEDGRLIGLRVSR